MTLAPNTRAGTIDPLVCPRGHHSVDVGQSRIYCEVCHNNGHEVRAWDRSELVDLRREDPPLADDATPHPDAGGGRGE